MQWKIHLQQISSRFTIGHLNTSAWKSPKAGSRGCHRLVSMMSWTRPSCVAHVSGNYVVSQHFSALHWWRTSQHSCTLRSSGLKQKITCAVYLTKLLRASADVGDMPQLQATPQVSWRQRCCGFLQIPHTLEGQCSGIQRCKRTLTINYTLTLPAPSHCCSNRIDPNIHGVVYSKFLGFNTSQLVIPFLNWRGTHNLPLCKPVLTVGLCCDWLQQ